MATLITLVDGDVATVAPVNANFQALNSAIAGAATVVYSVSALGINVGTVETTLLSFALPANTFTAVGDTLHVRSYFEVSNAAATWAVKFYVGTAAGTINVTTVTGSTLSLVVDLLVRCTSVAVTGAVSVEGVAIKSAVGVPTSPVLEGAGLFIGSTAIGSSFASPVTVKFTGTSSITSTVRQFGMTTVLMKVPA